MEKVISSILLACLLAGVTAESGVCPPGYFRYDRVCAPCWPGSYKPQEGDQACSPCPPGYICSAAGLAKPVSMCPAGFFCQQGCDGGLGGAGGTIYVITCPPGHYCHEGSSRPTMCPKGTTILQGQGKSLLECKENL